MIKNLQKKRACPPSRLVGQPALRKGLAGSRRGFVILFAVTLSAIFLSVALGISDIALKELKFSTSAKDTNDAFFAADTGVERTLFKNYQTPSFYIFKKGDGSKTYTQEIITELGSTGANCAKVDIEKEDSVNNSILLTITSRGYNIGDNDGSCNSSNPNRVEREITAFYID